jgi:formylglycine-generating enzyme required for sulfatase activity
MDANEAVHDINQNGSFETGEYYDLDGNGQYSPGLTTVFRAGANIPNYGKMDSETVAGIWHSFYPIKNDANGYRLPNQPIANKLATGGNHQKKWPWGDDNPPGLGGTAYADFAQHVRATAGGNNVSSPSPATARQANGYGMKDVIGNVAEWQEGAWESDDGLGNVTISALVYGGSYLGLGQVNTPSTFSNPNSGAPGWTLSNLWDLTMAGNPTTTSPAIGLRCVRYEP